MRLLHFTALSILLTSTIICAADTTNPDWGDEGRTAPLSMVKDLPVVYENHMDVPSQSGNNALIGPVQFLRRAIINEDAKQVTVPLYCGHMTDGTTAWYVLTDTTNKEIADQMGLIYTTKMRYADQRGAVRPATWDHQGAFIFESGAIDFTPVHNVTAGTMNNQSFPPSYSSPGSVADSDYTPIVKTPDGVYYNAPVIAYNVSAAQLQQMYTSGSVDYSMVHDKIVSINPANYSVTLKMTVGFSFSKPIFYLSTDASDPLVAALELSTYAPAMQGNNETVRGIDSIVGQGNERLALIVNGPVNLPNGDYHPYRQGISSAIADGQDPLNIFGGIPTINLDYSPLWNIEMVQWTNYSMTNNYVRRITAYLPDLFSYEAQGLIESYGGGAIQRSGLIINCPVLARLV